MALGLILGIGSAAFGAYGQYQQSQAAQSAAYANNKSRKQAYYQQVAAQQRQWQQALRIRKLQEEQFQKQVEYNGIAAGRAYTAEYERAAQMFEGARFQGQDNLKTLISASGMSAAKGRTGRGVERSNLVANMSQYGQAQALIANNLTRGISGVNANLQAQRDQLEAANYRAWVPVSAPMMTPDPIAPPQMQAIPQTNWAGMASTLLGGAAQAFGTYQSQKAPKAYTGNTSYVPQTFTNPAVYTGFDTNSISGINYGNFGINTGL